MRTVVDSNRQTRWGVACGFTGPGPHSRGSGQGIYRLIGRWAALSQALPSSRLRNLRTMAGGASSRNYELAKSPKPPAPPASRICSRSPSLPSRPPQTILRSPPRSAGFPAVCSWSLGESPVQIAACSPVGSCRRASRRRSSAWPWLRPATCSTPSIVRSRSWSACLPTRNGPSWPAAVSRLPIPSRVLRCIARRAKPRRSPTPPPGSSAERSPARPTATT